MITFSVEFKNVYYISHFHVRRISLIRKIKSITCFLLPVYNFGALKGIKVVLCFTILSHISKGFICVFGSGFSLLLFLFMKQPSSLPVLSLSFLLYIKFSTARMCHPSSSQLSWVVLGCFLWGHNCRSQCPQDD